MKRQQGFTLIELIVVIVILGILAATAMPKFIGLQQDARMASAQGAMGAISSASAIAHSAFLARTPPPATIEGTPVTYVNGYPNGLTIAGLAGLTPQNYTLTPLAGSLTVTPLGAPAASCTVTYTAAAVGASPTLITTPATLVYSGC